VYHSDSEDPGVDMHIRMYDINTKKKITVTSSGDPEDPHVWGTKIIWADAYNLMGYIAMYDTSTGKTIDVTHEADYDDTYGQYGASTGTHIAIQEDKIVYNKVSTDPEGVAGVYMYSIASGQSTLLYNYPPGTYTTPEVYGNIVVWGFAPNYGSGTGGTDIYLCDLAAESEKPTATFTANVTSGVAPLKVQFTSETTGNPTDYYWVFEPSTRSDWSSHHAVTAVHTFTQPGIYTVSLTVTNDAGSYTATREGYVIVTDASGSTGKPVVNFNSPLAEAELNDLTDHGIYENEIVAFFDNSTGSPTSWFWDFGDGNTSTQQNPTHVYGKRGGYTVTLTAGNTAGSDTISKYGYVLVGTGDEPASPAYFSSDKTSGNAPLTVTFVDDRDAEFPNYPIWRMWDFGDGVIQTYMVDANESATPYATHVYGTPGKYSVTLYLDNRGGKSIITKHNYITVIDPAIPVADFSSNVTSGIAPLAVLFTDASTGEAPTSWFWDFGDGINSKNAMNATHTFTTPGIYTVSLTVGNAAGNNMVTKPSYIVVTDPNAPLPNFSCSVTKGYAPLTVQFTDLSQKAASRIWDFNNDGLPDSSDAAPVYTYAVPGTYTAKLTAVNANGTVSKTAEITVLKKSSSGGGSSGSSGGGGGSPEPAKNVEVKELTQAFITGDKNVKFDFTRNATCVVYVSFDAKKTLGKTTTIAEMLKGKSALVSELPSGEVYKSFNVWVGNGGIANSKNIENPVVCFKVERAWLQNRSIDPASITLNRYSDKKWEQLPANISGENEEYIYFTAETPEFSSFAITGKSKKSSEETEAQLQTGSETGTLNQDNTGVSKLEAELKAGQEAEQESENQDSRSLPGFEVYYTVIGLLAVFLYKRK
jgi:PGF-pre-PGF domain-containing protein